MPENICFAPHLDDEIIGCYSVLDNIDTVVYWTRDYRETNVEAMNDDPAMPDYVHRDDINLDGREINHLYIPSKHDFHPLHKEVHLSGIRIAPNAKHVRYYSVEMNVPWLKEEEESRMKKALFYKWYPGEVNTITKSDKYFLFKSVQPFDEYIWAVVRFEREGFHCWPDAPDEVKFLRNEHRHKFFFEVSVQQFGDDRDLEYFIIKKRIEKFVLSNQWAIHTSCEMFARQTRDATMLMYPGRAVRVSVMEDGENGCILE